MNSYPFTFLLLILGILSVSAKNSEEIYNSTDRPKEQDTPNEPPFEQFLEPNALNPRIDQNIQGIGIFWLNLSPQITHDDLEELERNESNISKEGNFENVKRNKRALSFTMPRTRSYELSQRIRPLPSTLSTQTRTTWGSRIRNGLGIINTGLKPLSRGTNILSDSSTVVANVFNMYHTSMLTSATIKAQEAQTRANDLVSKLNQVDLNEKKVGVKRTVLHLENEIGKLRRDVNELEGLNANSNPSQKHYNNMIIQEKNEEIKLKQKEIELYREI